MACTFYKQQKNRWQIIVKTDDIPSFFKSNFYFVHIIIFIIFIFSPGTQENFVGAILKTPVNRLSRSSSKDAKILLSGWNFFLVF